MLLTACSGQSSQTATRTEFLLDTFVTVTLYGSKDEKILDEAMELCRYYDHMLDRHNPESELSRLNRSREPMEIDPELYQLLEIAKEFAALSGGRYDMTIAPVMDLWDFKSGSHRVPTREELTTALERVNQDNLLLLGNNTAQLTGGAQVDLGSIAKGMIADKMAAYLREQQVPGAIVNLGGNVMAIGQKAGNKPFVIGVQKPFGPSQEVMGTLEISELSLVSSGVYERGFTGEDGVRYHHIIDATTGMPASTGLLSVTIVSPSSTDADALSTLCFLLGPQEGMALIEALDDTEAVFITDEEETLLTSGLVDRYHPA